MSGPLDPSDGRAVNANQAPSAEKAADWPTTDTPLAIARVAAIVGSGVAVNDAADEGVGVTVGLGSVVPVGSTVGVGSWVGPAEAVPVGVAVGVPLVAGVGLGLGAVLAVSVGEAVASVAVGVVVGVGVGVRVGFGVARGGCVPCRPWAVRRRRRSAGPTRPGRPRWPGHWSGIR